MKFAAIFHLLSVSSIYAVGATVEESTTNSAIPRRRLAATYAPGDFSKAIEVTGAGDGRKLFLSNGLKATIIGSEGKPVMAADGTELATYHKGADGGATFPIEGGGYYYVSNSEIGSEYPLDFVVNATASRTAFAANLTGGVYAWEFNAKHEVVGYEQLLDLTSGNCAGGATPWGTWVSCEERRMWGQCWQVDPAGVIDPRPTVTTGPMGIEAYGNWEAFAWDEDHTVGYTTNDDYPKEGLPATRGAIVRFTPDEAAKSCLAEKSPEEQWCTLESGTLDFLKLDTAAGTFEWVTDLEEANPTTYAGSEGSHYEDGVLTFVTIVDKSIFRLNVKDLTYTKTPVPFPQEPDNIRILGDVLYVCTDGDANPDDGVWGIDKTGAFRVFKEEGHNYPAGVAFSPDNMMMYVSMWGEATYQISREDGMAFDDETAGIKYEGSAPAPAPGGGSAPTAGGSSTGSGSVGGNGWSLTKIMATCVVAVALQAFTMS